MPVIALLPALRLPGRATRAPAPPWEAVVERCAECRALLSRCRLDLTMDDLAAALRMRDVLELRRYLRRRRLPPFRLLRDWWYVVTLLERREASGGAPGLQLLLGGRDPAPYFRLLRRTTGVTWAELRDRGSEWARRAALRAWEPFLVRVERPGRAEADAPVAMV